MRGARLVVGAVAFCGLAAGCGGGHPVAFHPVGGTGSPEVMTLPAGTGIGHARSAAVGALPAGKVTGYVVKAECSQEALTAKTGTVHLVEFSTGPNPTPLNTGDVTYVLAEGWLNANPKFFPAC